MFRARNAKSPGPGVFLTDLYSPDTVDLSIGKGGEEGGRLKDSIEEDDKRRPDVNWVGASELAD